MLCQICAVNQATIHIQEVAGSGEKHSMHLCTECAEKKAMDDPMFKEFNLPEMLYNLTHNISDPSEIFPHSHKQDEEQTSPPGTALTCPSCGWDNFRLRKTGRMGCPVCYQVFTEYLSNLLPGMHRGKSHVGKIPFSGQTQKEVAMVKDYKSKEALQNEIHILKKNLDESVRREEFELAAELRDKIAALNTKLKLPSEAKSHEA